MNPFSRLTAVAAPLDMANIDTDKIIPARYLKAVDKASVAEGLFADWRYNPDGSPKEDFVLNQPQYRGAQILLAGDNFGCGSSREHAPWALSGGGVRVIIATSFADIFFNNALKNGLLPIVVDPTIHRSLVDLSEEAPQAEITIDLENQAVGLPDGSTVLFSIDAFAKKCLLKGVDQLGYILSFEDQIRAYEQQHPNR